MPSGLREYYRKNIKSFDCFNCNRLLEAAMNSNGILVNEKLRLEMIDKLNQVRLLSGIYLTRSYYKFKYTNLSNKIGSLSEYSELINNPEFKWISKVGVDPYAKTILEFISTECFDASAEVQLDLSKFRKLVKSEDTYNKFIELLEQWKSWYYPSNIIEIARKRSQQQSVLDCFANELNYELLHKFNQGTYEKINILFRKFNLLVINKKLYKNYTLDNYDEAIEEFKRIFEITPLEINKVEILNQTDIRQYAKDRLLEFTKSISNSEEEKIPEKIEEYINSFKTFDDVVNLYNYYQELHKFDELEDYSLLEKVSDKKFTYDNRMINYDEMYNITEYMNFGSPAMKNDLNDSAVEYFKDINKKCAVFFIHCYVHEIEGEDTTSFKNKEYFNKFISDPSIMIDYDEEAKKYSETDNSREANRIRLTRDQINGYVSHIPMCMGILHGYDIFNDCTISDDSVDGIVEYYKFLLCKNVYNTITKQLQGYIQGQLEKDLWYISWRNEDGSFVRSDKKSGPGWEDYRLYVPNWNVNGVNTKRWSAGIHTWKQGTDVFRLLEAEEDNVALYFDISQAEVRFIAYYSGDENMIEMYDKGIDLYVKMSEMAFPKNTDPGFHKSNRTIFKAVVLGVLYGRGAWSISEATGLPVDESKRLIKTFHKMFPTLSKFIEESKQYCCETGLINTALGDKLEADKERGMTVGINWIIQEAASIVLAEGFYNLYAEGYKSKRYIHPKVVVHDSHTFTVHASQFIQIIDDIDRNFKKYLLNKYKVPFKYDLITMTNLRDKVEFSYTPETKELKLKGNEYGVDSWIKVISKFYNLTILDETKFDRDRVNFIRNAAENEIVKFFNYYPDHNFELPRYKTMKLKIEQKENS